MTHRIPLADLTADQLDALYMRLDEEQEVSRRLLAQRQEMAEERYAWQERGDKAEAALERVRQVANRLRLDSPWGRSTADRITAAIDGPSQAATEATEEQQ